MFKYAYAKIRIYYSQWHKQNPDFGALRLDGAEDYAGDACGKEVAELAHRVFISRELSKLMGGV
jgi:hypothetical protein